MIIKRNICDRPTRDLFGIYQKIRKLCCSNTLYILPTILHAADHALYSLAAADHAYYLAALSVADKAHLNSETLSGASDWLEVCPSGEACMSPEEFRNELKVRSLQNIHPANSLCELCGYIMDRKARHGHNGIRDRICKFHECCTSEPRKKKPCFLQPSPDRPNAAGRRPGTVFLRSWHLGQWFSCGWRSWGSGMGVWGADGGEDLQRLFASRLVVMEWIEHTQKRYPTTQRLQY